MDERWAIVIAAVAGVAAALSGARPTGSAPVDIALTAVAIGFVTWAAASAPWWSVAAAAGLATVVAMHPVMIPIGAAAFLGGLWIGFRRRDLPEARAIVAAVALNVLARSELDLVFGATSAIGLAAALLVAVTGLQRRRRAVQRPALIGLGAVAAALVLAAGLFAATVLSTRSSLSDGNRFARTGIEQLSAGDADGAKTSFERAARAFERADSSVGRMWTQPARVVPVVAQHRRAIVDLSSSAAATTAELAVQLERFDLDRLRVIDGRIDIAAVRAMEDPLARMQIELDRFDAVVEELRNPWLVPPLVVRLDDLQDDIERRRRDGDTAMEALRLAPSMLGEDDERVYFVAFTTPVEARGHGGFMGNWAELTIDAGRIELTDFGRHTDLNDAVVGTGSTVTGPSDWLGRYGRFGFTNGPGGTVARQPWSNITMSPHFPSTAAVITELYPQSGGQRIDGVFALDVFALAALLEFTGPIEADRLSEPLTTETAVDFLLLDQYLLPDATQDDRVDLLEDVALAVVDRLLAGALPGPTDVARVLGPFAAEGRLSAFAPRAHEQALLDRINLTSALPPAGDRDILAVTFNNASGNKVDNFLDVEIHHEVYPDPSTSTVAGEVTLTITNSAPTSGLPGHVIGNAVGLPTGANRTLVSIYTAGVPVNTTLDGEPLAMEVGREAGHYVSSTYAELEAGSARTISLAFEGTIDFDEGYRLGVRSPPLVRPATMTLTVIADDGNVASTTVDRPGIHDLTTDLDER